MVDGKALWYRCRMTAPPVPAAVERLRMYSDLAPWFPLITAPEDYAEEAELVRDLWLVHATAPPRTALELGAGGGNTASHLKAWFDLTLVDLSPDMVAVSRRLNPECAHHVGDMRSVRLGQVFDAVLIHDAITYLTSAADLAAAFATAQAHCRPGGVLVVMPDCVAETFAPETQHGGHDGPDGEALRYLEWSWDPDPEDTRYEVLFAFAIRERDGSLRVVEDRHTNGLFPRALWLQLLTDAGFRASQIIDAWGRDVFIGVRAPDGPPATAPAPPGGAPPAS